PARAGPRRLHARSRLRAGVPRHEPAHARADGGERGRSDVAPQPLAAHGIATRARAPAPSRRTDAAPHDRARLAEELAARALASQGGHDDPRRLPSQSTDSLVLSAKCGSAGEGPESGDLPYAIEIDPGGRPRPHYSRRRRGLRRGRGRSKRYERLIRSALED